MAMCAAEILSKGGGTFLWRRNLTKKYDNVIRTLTTAFFFKQKKREKINGKRNFSNEDVNIVKSNYRDVEIPDVPLHEFVFQKFSKWETKIAVECGQTEKKLTFRDIFRSTKAIGASLQKKFKIKKGDTFAIVLPNCPEYPVILLAGSLIGAIPTTVNPTYTSTEIAHQLQDTNVKLIFTINEIHGKCTEAMKKVKLNIPIILVKTSPELNVPAGAVLYDELVKNSSLNLEPVNVNSDEVVVLPYSSGTSGVPKGVQLTHRNLVSNLIQYRSDSKLKANPHKDTNQCSILGVLPMFHIYGMVIITLDSISEGAHLVSLPKFEPKLMVNTLHNKKIQILYLVPPLVFFLSNSPMVESKHLQHAQYAVVGAAPCGGNDLEKLMSRAKNLSTCQGYGMTETSPLITMSDTDRFHKIASSGHPVALTFIKVSDVNTGKALPKGETGEICVKGPQVMKGYLNRSEETKSTFDEEGWLRTGDIGYYDDQKDFFIVDRIKELIKVKGFQVAPAELEEFIRRHPKVADVGVIGVKHPQLGEVPKAFVVLKEGVTCTEEEIKDFIKDSLSAYKQLNGGVDFVKEIPKSSAGKILRKILKEKSK